MNAAGRTGELARCPSCGGLHPAADRFCPECHLPLTPLGPADDGAAGARHERARKVKPQLTEGDLVRITSASNQAEAEFVQGLLLEEGVPSLVRRAAGFDVPDFLAAGPRDILVPASGLGTAREILLEAELIGENAGRTGPAPLRLLAGLLLALAIGALLVWMVIALGH